MATISGNPALRQSAGAAESAADGLERPPGVPPEAESGSHGMLAVATPNALGPRTSPHAAAMGPLGEERRELAAERTRRAGAYC